MHSTGLYQGNNKKVIDVGLITMLWPSMNGYVFSSVLDRRMIGNYNLKMMLKWLWSVLRYYPTICLEGMRKVTNS